MSDTSHKLIELLKSKLTITAFPFHNKEKGTQGLILTIQDLNEDLEEVEVKYCLNAYTSAKGNLYYKGHKKPLIDREDADTKAKTKSTKKVRSVKDI